MEKELVFEATYTVEDFKRVYDCGTIEIWPGKQGSFWFTTSKPEIRGTVSSKLDIRDKTKPIKISLCIGEITKENPDGRFFMIHNGRTAAATL